MNIIVLFESKRSPLPKVQLGLTETVLKNLWTENKGFFGNRYKVKMITVR